MSLTRYVVLLLLFLLAGCADIRYLSHLAKGQYEVIAKRTPIQQVLDNPDTDERTRAQLELVNRIRAFASAELALPESRDYTSYTALNRQHVVWNVLAAPAHSITLKQWCFPIVGCLAYRGYFSEQAARKLEHDLSRQGYDTYLYGVSAYSTLGWFTDPVLDTFLFYPETSLAAVIFHELAHQVVYVQDDPSFNEAFATAVEQEGVRRWMASHGNPGRFLQYQAGNEKEETIVRLILKYRNRLEKAYDTLPEKDLEAAKHGILDGLREAYHELSGHGGGTPFFDWWFSRKLNNAQLSSIATYHRWVPAFRRLIRDSDSLPAFYAAVKNRSNLSPEKRLSWLRQLLPP